MDIAALIISIVALLASSVIAIVQIANNKKYHEVNLDANLSGEIFKEYLTENFPRAFQKICFRNNKLSDIDEMHKVLLSFMQKIRFYRYLDENFHTKIVTLCQGLEDYIVMSEDSKFTAEEQRKANEIIVSYIKDIYREINKKYKNG